MIDMDKVKIALFDFDDTLCIHAQHGDEEEDHFVKNMILGKDHWTEKGCVPNKQIHSFLLYCKGIYVRIGLISWTGSFLHMKTKQKWAEEKYHPVKFENFCVGTLEGKIEIMQGLCEAYGYAREQILIVDDLYKTLSVAENRGFQACTPMEVVNFVNSHALCSEGR